MRKRAAVAFGCPVPAGGAASPSRQISLGRHREILSEIRLSKMTSSTHAFRSRRLPRLNTGGALEKLVHIAEPQLLGMWVVREGQGLGLGQGGFLMIYVL